MKLLYLILSVSAQDSLPRLPAGYLAAIQGKAQLMSHQLDKQTDKAVDELAKRKRKMKARLAKVDSFTANGLFITDPTSIKSRMQSGLPVSDGDYLDTLKNTIRFLDGALTRLIIMNIRATPKNKANFLLTKRPVN
jgi:hypothetical protein